MSAKAIVMGIAKADEDYSDVAGLIHIDDNTVFIYADDISVSIPVSELMDFIKSEMMRE